MDDTRDMTADDQERLKAHTGSHNLFKSLLSGPSADGRAPLVAVLSPSGWNLLRRLVELGYVNIEDGRVIIMFTVSSLVQMGYLG